MPVVLAMFNPAIDKLPMAFTVVRLEAEDATSWHYS